MNKKAFQSAFISSVLLLTACSTSHRAVDNASTVIPKHLYANKNEVIIQEGALWPGETSDNLLFEDSKARVVGDIVTVTINETNESTQSASTDTSKNATMDMQATALLGLPTSLGVQNFLGLGNQFDPSVNTSIANQNQGTGTVSRNGSLTANISALITEILPSGNFRIEGRRSVTVNHEEQILVLRGIIRPQDINFDNTILSRWIADASISLTGEGVVADEQRKGWLAKVLSKVWPF
ncbi:MAG: flagellar basal body L-ring protein FlgH [Nitrospinaceae bacterium]|nr:flagellar basal body L-ring protein FlgH [Nitrospina sp.]MBT5377023.1 flagellar basal body L-ring protein FlgH [Nitrospinaceae bacterium]MBT6345893.1 flagellar basal body L-ring protein FlgH [Nitrospina sp.]